jgi:3-hydroxybutyrate dehydrogenase
MSPVDLHGKVALVTGATSGIGLEIAKALSRHRANVVFNGHLPPGTEAQPLCDLIASAGGWAAYLAADLMDRSQVEGLLEGVISSYGGVDVLVNNAGIQHVAAVDCLPADRWDAILAVNLSAAFHATRLALPSMKARGWGRIINIASVHGLVASVHKSAYVAAKHGLVGLTKVTALETARLPITCNAICPGFVGTPLAMAQFEALARNNGLTLAEARSRMVGDKQPSGGLVEASQVAAMAMFLIGDTCSEVRGATWTIDGGWTAQ